MLKFRLSLIITLISAFPTAASANVIYRCLFFGSLDRANACRVRIGYDANNLVRYEIKCAHGPTFEQKIGLPSKIEFTPNNGYTLNLPFPGTDKATIVKINTNTSGDKWPEPTGLFESHMKIDSTDPTEFAQPGVCLVKISGL